MLFVDAAAREKLAHDLVFEFVKEHRPTESILFPDYWRQFISRRHSATPEQRSGLLREMGADRNAHVHAATPYVSVCVWAVLEDLCDQKVHFRLEDISEALKSTALALGASKALSQRIAERLGPKIAAAFKPRVPPVETLFAVDYISRKPDGSLDRPRSERLTETEVVRRFQRNAIEFQLYVDDSRQEIFAGDDEPRANLWDRVPGNPMKLLRLVLQGFPTGTLTYEAIRLEVLEDPYHDDLELAVPRARLKKRLNDRLNNVLSSVLEADRDNGYEVRGRITYCWIRLAGAPAASPQ